MPSSEPFPQFRTILAEKRLFIVSTLLLAQEGVWIAQGRIQVEFRFLRSRKSEIYFTQSACGESKTRCNY